MIPTIRQRVKIEGRDEVFLVVWVDLKRGVADLVPVEGDKDLEEDVPFSNIRSVTGGLANAAD